jgi:hypothetical protein
MVTAGTGADTAGSGAQGGSGATSGTGGAPEGGSGNEAGESSAGGEDTGGTGGSGGAGGSGGTGGASGGSGGNASTGGGGSGGTGGAPGPKCSDHPLTAKSSWIATGNPTSNGNGMEADPLYNPPSHVLDGSLNERWSTGQPQAGGEWLQIDFGEEVSIKQLALILLSDNSGNGGDYPRAYEVRLSNSAPAVDGTPNFTPPIRASGAGVQNSNLTLNFPAPISGRYLSIRQTGATASTEWWTVAELNVSCPN